MRTLIFAQVAALLFLGGTSVHAQWWCYDGDVVRADVEGSTVTVFHDAALYNCCPDAFEYAVTQNGNQILVEEAEILTVGCLCLCCYDLSVVIEDVAPGDYLIVFRWDDYETGQWQERIVEITVPDVGQGGDAAVAGVFGLTCLDEPTAVPEDDDPEGETSQKKSWGEIKADYGS